MSEIFDLTGDGIADTTSVDTNGDGVNVAETGQPVFGPGDRDSDGYNDNQDAHPDDPFRA